jgi:hypothetical protein
MLWVWEASAPGAAASGVCGDVGQAQCAAAGWMRANGADAALLEQVRLAISAGSLMPHHERTGTVLRARRYSNGRIRWRLAAANRAA